MGPGLATSTQASRQKNRVDMMGVETKNRKKARQNCGKSAASRADSRRSSPRGNEADFAIKPTESLIHPAPEVEEEQTERTETRSSISVTCCSFEAPAFD